jgi:hypothetical protein
LDAQPNQHDYPLHNATPEQLEVLINEILQSKMTDMSRTFAQEWDKREQNFAAENAELRAQLEAANDQGPNSKNADNLISLLCHSGICKTGSVQRLPILHRLKI